MVNCSFSNMFDPYNFSQIFHKQNNNVLGILLTVSNKANTFNILQPEATNKKGKSKTN